MTGPSVPVTVSSVTEPALRELEFRLTFRKYQRLILDRVADSTDRKYHIAAPPGSGKTIVGIELIRRFGRRAVVFAPTTTIQEQWLQQMTLFLPEGRGLAPIAGDDPTRLRPINVFTYQLISTPAAAQAMGHEMAERDWIAELLREGRVKDESAARSRLETLREHNPDAFQREINQRYTSLRHQLLRDEGVNVSNYLHPHAKRLIDDLAAQDIGTVVLDECHHLLDYWAIVLRALIARLREPQVVGLTATLPSPEDDEEYDNYTSLLGDVDFEVPTPAVVKEGSLAPYRDLVYFVRPSARELARLEGIEAEFGRALASITGGQEFLDWTLSLLPQSSPQGGPAFAEFLVAVPLLSLAVLRYLRSRDSMPPALPIPHEAESKPTVDDWLTLLERYALDRLKTSADPADHKRLHELRTALLAFGVTITERGVRQGRSAGDLILALSESKDQATATILGREQHALGDSLRAVVVTDFERMSAGVSRATVLDRDAGSAVRVFRMLARRPELTMLSPALVTGSRVEVSAAAAGALVPALEAQLRTMGASAGCLAESVAEGVVAVRGVGSDWTPGTYVRALTALFDRGLIRCLVGTRGIFGEGWDSVTVNTLIDLTAVTTSASVQQLRGRTIRKDPAWPRKVAHNWDVVCVAPSFTRGDVDLRRFERRHERFWGIVVPSQSWLVWDLAAAAGERAEPGGVVKGISHVDQDLAYELATKSFKDASFEVVTDRMLRTVGDREATYRLWGVGDEYSNFAWSATRLDPRDLKIRTVFTLEETLVSAIRELRLAIVASLAAALLYGAHALRGGLALAIVVAVAVALLGFALSAPKAFRLLRRMLREQPSDAILRDVGRALLEALRAAGLVSERLRADYLRVIDQPDGSCEVALDYASPEDAACFVEAYRQIFEPVRDQRYLILRDDGRLPNAILSPFWLGMRALFARNRGYAPAYHPVPSILATRKEFAESYAASWARYVGGGKLVFTRSPEGRSQLLQARAQRRPEVRGLAFQVWR